MSTPNPPRIVELGGKLFAWLPLEHRTVAREHFMFRAEGLCGLRNFQPAEGDSDYSMMLRMVDAAFESGSAHLLVAAHIVPAALTEQDWNVGFAEETAKYIALCCIPSDREQVNALIGFSVLAIFEKEIARLRARGPTRLQRLRNWFALLVPFRIVRKG